MANSWINAASVLGLNLHLACPDGYQIDPAILDLASGGNMDQVRFTNDPKEAVKDADVVYTDVWASMGDEEEHVTRLKAFQGFEVNFDLLSHAKDDAIVMHCLPAHRDEEIAEDVLEQEGGVFWDQAENKRHMHKAILESLILK